MTSPSGAHPSFGTRAPQAVCACRCGTSTRHSRQTKSLPTAFDRVEKLTPGAVVDIEIDLLPIGLVFHPGEQLRLVISAQNLTGQWMPALREYAPQNKGTHVIHTGGSRASYLQLPIQTVV